MLYDRRLTFCIGLLLAVLLTMPALAGSHLWRFNEIYSNAGGTIMFIEMKECCGADNEVFLHSRYVASDTTGQMYLFTRDLPCSNCTANKYLLLATQGFADLPGAPTQDYIIADNFFARGGDTLRYYIYEPAVWTHGAVPNDGVNSLQIDGSIAPNSPTNFAGETGSIAVRCAASDTDFSGSVDIMDLLAVLADWGPCPAPCDSDIVSDGAVNIEDLLQLLAEWGDCP